MTRLARTVMRSDSTRTLRGECTISRTGVLSTTRRPSRLAISSETRCDPPTNRRSCAPSRTLNSRSNVPTVCSLPAAAVVASANRNETSRASDPRIAWKASAVRLRKLSLPE